MASKPRYLLNRGGRYFARLVVPPDLRPFLLDDDKGKTELREPLGPDYRAAVKRLPSAVTLIQHKIAQAERRKHEANATPLPVAPRYLLSDEDIARRVYEARLGTDERLRDRIAAYARTEVSDEWLDCLRRGVAGALDNHELHDLVGLTIERFVAAGNSSAEFETPEWRRLARLVCQGMLEAATRTAERNVGNFSGVSANAIFLARDEPLPHVPVSLQKLFSDYVADRARLGKGREAARSWARVVEDLISFVGHDDVTSYTKANVREWRDAKLQTLNARTVAGVYLAGIRTILNWAVENDYITENPAQNVRQQVPKKIRAREQGYTNDEARAVLAAARDYEPVEKDGMPAREAPKMTAAKRWLPWLAAFTGARISELAQARREDFRQEHGTWILRITPGAGTVKTGQYRDVPIHTQLIALGFEDYLLSGSGPLFFYPEGGRDPITASRTVADRVGKWLKGAGLVPQGVSPNHGFRHRFKTIGLEKGIAERVLDAICGHAGRTAGENYGDVTVKARISAVSALDPIPLRDCGFAGDLLFASGTP